MRFPTLHASRAKALAREEDGMVMVLRVFWILFLLHEGPAAHVLQTPRGVSTLDKANGLWAHN